MRNKLYKIVPILVILIIGVIGVQTITSCSGGDDNPGGTSSGSGNPVWNGEPIKKAKISGVSQKGPFIRGSEATLYELNSDLSQTGKNFQDIIADDKGSFEIKGVELVSPYALLKADGFYRNEVTGQISNSKITLYAIADVTEKSSVNVNILTHLEYRRVMKLAEDGMSIMAAKKQAQREILAVFGISGDFADSEDMSIFGTGEGDAALLAISILLQRDLNEGNFTATLSDFNLSFAANGTWDNETAKTAMADWASSADLEGIRSNIRDWGFSSEVPVFEKYIYNYWVANYRLGECIEDMVKANGNRASANKSYACENSEWRLASDIEANSGVCTEAIQGKIGNIGMSYYACDNRNWRLASDIEANSGVCTEAIQGKIDNIETGYYYCDNRNWRAASYIEIKCFKSKDCLYFTDVRDGQIYNFVKIGNQTWMAENLNYNATGSKCGNGSSLSDANTATCMTYGRLYNWATAMALAPTCNLNSCVSQINAKHRGICPSGWHIPSRDEWTVLIDFVGGSTSGTKLKASSGWNTDSGYIPGTDDYGFSALPGGGGNPDGTFGTFGGAGVSGIWWSSSENSESSDYAGYVGYAGYFVMYDSNESAYWHTASNKPFFHSVRCLQD